MLLEFIISFVLYLILFISLGILVLNILPDVLGYTDENVFQITTQLQKEEDSNYTIDGGEYASRIERLMQDVNSVNGSPLDIKVFISEEVNAYAWPHNAIRIYSGMMDIMTDNELIAIIGHEIGHIKHGDTKKSFRNEVLFDNAAKVLETIFNMNKISSAILENYVVRYLNAHYDRKQEYEADDYAVDFTVSRGYPPTSMADALHKFVVLFGTEQSWKISKLFATHPDSDAREKRLRENRQELIGQFFGDY